MDQVLKFCKTYEMYESPELYENKFTVHCDLVTRWKYWILNNALNQLQDDFLETQLHKEIKNY